VAAQRPAFRSCNRAGHLPGEPLQGGDFRAALWEDPILVGESVHGRKAGAGDFLPPSVELGPMRTGAMALLASVRTWFVISLLLLVGLLVVDFATTLPANKWWADVFSVATNLTAGAIVSFLFYFLVVHLPEARKKSVIKTNLLHLYRTIKEDILQAVVHASIKGGRKDLSANLETIEELMTPAGFKAAFQGGREADEGFYAFENQMDKDTPEFRQIVLHLEMLSKQIEFLLHNYTISDQAAFDFFKRLELGLMQIRANGPGYDESKQLCGFIWEVYAGWNPFMGDTGGDVIEKMIDSL
jgi:hypothetical protein